MYYRKKERLLSNERKKKTEFDRALKGSYEKMNSLRYLRKRERQSYRKKEGVVLKERERESYIEEKAITIERKKRRKRRAREL